MKKLLAVILSISLLCGMDAFEIAKANTPSTATHGYNYFDYVFFHKKSNTSNDHITQFAYAMSDNLSNVVGTAKAYVSCTSYGCTGTPATLVVNMETTTQYHYALSSAPAFISTTTTSANYVSGYIATYGDIVLFKGTLHYSSGTTEAYANACVKG